MPQGTNMPAPWFTGLDDSGRPLAGGRLYTYLAGSDTLLPTYSDAGLTTANANPVVLDAGGRAAVYLGPYAYKFILKNASDVLVKQQDVVSAVAPFSLDTGISSVAGESLAAGKAAFLSDGSGGRTAGRWYLTDADDTAMSTTPVSVGIVSAQILIGQTGSMQIGGRATGLSGLTAGTAYYLSTTPGGLTSTPPTNARLVGVADSTTSLVLADSTGQIPASRITAGSFSAGDFTFVGGMRASAAHASASGTLANPGVISFETPVTRIYTGDGTGYAIEFAKRGSSVTTRLVRINETGLTVEVNGGLNVGGTTDPGDNNLRVEGTALVVGQTFAADGTVSAPGVAFTSDTDCGVYRTGTNSVGITAGGTMQAVFSGGQVRAAAGTAAAPSHSFNGDPNTGLYSAGADSIGIAVAGSAVGTIGGLGDLELSGYIEATSARFTNTYDVYLTGATVLGTITNYSFALRVTSAASTPRLSGVGKAPDGSLLLVINASGTSFDVEHEYVSATASNRIYCPSSANKTIPANGCAWLYGDATSSRWRLVSL